ncbi:MAG: hypothetical protein L6308_01120 [Candidatus Omnitrophica bacterium]|nr:hypothetical protein [Candidatus Omnitrophota bacterium]
MISRKQQEGINRFRLKKGEMNMRKYCFLLLVASVILSGCGTYAKFTYPSDYNKLIQLYEKPKYPINVGVLPLDDKRLNENNFGGYFLYLIPLMPFGSAQYTRPDSATMFNTISKFDFNVSEDLAKAIVTSLRKANLFENVYFSYGGDLQSDLLIKGSILSTDYEGKIYSYGLSFVGPLLWYFGLPCGSSYNELKLEIVLNKADTQDVLWDYAINNQKRVVQGMYYSWGHDVKGYSEILQDSMNEAIKSLNEKLLTIPIDKLKRKR